MVGRHCIKFWSKTQHNITLSSAEAELVALVKGGCEGKGLVALMKDLGLDTPDDFDIYTDANAAIGIVQREGVGRTRHIDVNMLWVQQRQKEGEMSINKVDTKYNPADIMTKAVPIEVMWRHVTNLGFESRDGRADTAVALVNEN